MDNTSWKDISGNGNDGTGYDDVTTGAGVYNNSGVFDGDGDSVRNTNTFQEVSTSKNYTMSAWIKLSSGSPEGTIINNAIAGADRNGLVMTDDASGRYVALATYDGSTSKKVHNLQLNIGEWYHVVGIRDSGTNYIYVNGVSGSGGSGTPQYTSDTNFEIGGILNAGCRYFNGSIDEVMIFNRSLSESEIKELYVKGRANWDYTDYQDVEDGSVNIPISNSTTNVLPDIRLNANSSDGSSLFYIFRYNQPRSKSL